MRFVVLLDHLGVAGAIRWCVDLTNALVTAGHEVYLGTETGKPCEWLPCLTAVHQWDKLSVTACDVVFMVNYIRPLRDVADKLDAKHRILWIVGMDEWHLDEVLTTKDSATVNFRDAVTCGDYRVLCCAKWITDWIRANLQPDAAILLPGVNHELFHPVKGARRPGELKLLSSGKNRAREGSICVAEAARIIKRTYPAAKLETYAYKGIPQSEMARFYASGALWLDGQWYGGLCLAPTEAMACGCPVVCTRIGGVADYAIDGVNCLMVERENPQQMADAAIRLLRSPDLYEQFILAGYTAVKRLTWERTVKNLEQYIEGWE